MRATAAGRTRGGAWQGPGRALAALAERCAALRGWRRAMVAFALGLMSAAALPPFNLFPVLLLAFPPALWMLDGCERRRSAFALGWWFGFGFFVAGLYWIANALLIDMRFAWLLPFAVCGLPALLALFPGAAFLATRAVPVTGPARVLVFAAAWSVAEWLRGHILTGFPWNLIGYAWTGSDAMIQPVSLIGIYGLTLATVLAAAAPAALVPLRPGRVLPFGGLLLVAGAAGLLAAGWICGLVRLPDGAAPTHDDIRLRIVQANIDQRLKWQPEERVEVLRRHIGLSREGGGPAPDAVIWPETAVPFSVVDDPAVRDALTEAIPPEGGVLLTGAPRVDRESADGPRIWNSLVAIDSAAEVVGVFDKFHLVPFGEYVPFRNILARVGIEKITAGSIDFSTGPGPRTLRLPGLPPVSPLICYEVIFPRAVVPRADRPDWILNVTNDGWYGYSTGPFQHFAIARVRAVEEGLPLVRAANTGISAVVDPFGRETARLDLQTAGTIDAALPTALPTTWYGRFGDLPFLVLVLSVAGLAYACRASGRNSDGA